jgi:hypothetical protein
MIIVKIFQGPGNQMFQYAYGLAAAKRTGTDLKLDLTWFEKNSGHRSYILDRFNIQTPIASKDEVEYIRSKNGKNFLEYRYNLLRDELASRHRKAVVKEDLSKFDEELKRPYKNSYIEGYFSTEQFFADAKKEVCTAFQFVNQMPPKVQEIADSINRNTVAFSIRRGDFLGNPLHNICSIEYFKRAVERMKKVVPELNLLIFSDDIEWIESNSKFEMPHRFVQGVEDHMDHMRLMGLCKHHIIPNSTFSWWGAWLSKPKTVVAPNLWITDNEKVHQKTFGHWVETRHTVPESWIRIPAKLEGETMM